MEFQLGQSNEDQLAGLDFNADPLYSKVILSKALLGLTRSASAFSATNSSNSPFNAFRTLILAIHISDRCRRCWSIWTRVSWNRHGLAVYGYGPNLEATDVGIDGSPTAKRLATLFGMDWVGIRLGLGINSCIP